MGDPLTLAGAGAVLGGAGSTYGAAQQNHAIGGAMRSTVSQSQETLNQLQLQTAITAQKYANDARRVRGSIRVAAAGAGMAGSDLMALQRQAAFDADLNTRIAKADASAKARGVIAQTDANLTSLANQGQNALLAGFMGALKGAITGYSLGGTSSALDAGTADPTVWAGSNTPIPDPIVVRPTGYDPALGRLVL